MRSIIVLDRQPILAVPRRDMPIHGPRALLRQGTTFWKQKEAKVLLPRKRASSIKADAKGVVITGGNRGFG